MVCTVDIFVQTKTDRRFDNILLILMIIEISGLAPLCCVVFSLKQKPIGDSVSSELVGVG